MHVGVHLLPKASTNLCLLLSLILMPPTATLLGKDNLLVVKDPVRHAKLRALLQPAFSADAIKTYLPAIEALVARHLGDWQAAGPEGIKAYPRLKMLTFDFILQVWYCCTPACLLSSVIPFAWQFASLQGWFAPAKLASACCQTIVMWCKTSTGSARCAPSLPGVMHPVSVLCLQVVMGKEVPQPLLERLSAQFAELTMGLVAWPYLDLPFSPWRK